MSKKNIICSFLFHLVLIIILYYNLKELKYSGQFEFSLDTEEIAVEFQKITSMPIKTIPQKEKREQGEVKKDIKEEKVEEVKKEIKEEELKNSKEVTEEPITENKPETEKENLKEEKAEEETKQEIEPIPVFTKKEVKEEIEKENRTQEELDEFKDYFGDESVSFSGFYGDQKTFSNLIDLSPREKLIFLDQIKACKKRADEVIGDVKKEIQVIVEINKDGFFNIDSMIIANKEKFLDEEQDDLKKAIGNVKQTLKECSPLRNMPEDKYFIWKKVKLNFNSTEDKL